MVLICAIRPLNSRSAMASMCAVTICWGASRPRSVSSTRAAMRRVEVSGNSAIGAPAHAASPGLKGDCPWGRQTDTRLMVPARGACERHLAQSVLGAFDVIGRFLAGLNLAQDRRLA